MFQKYINFSPTDSPIKEEEVGYLNRKQIQQVILSANSFKQHILKKTSEVGQQYIDKHILQKLEPFKFIGYQEVFKLRPGQTIEQLSALNIIRQICLQQIQYLCQIQYEVDVFQKSLVKMPNGIPVYVFVSTLLTRNYKSIEQMYDDLCQGILSFNQNKIKAKKQLYERVLQFIWKVAMRFGFYIEEFTFTQLMFYNDIQNIISSKKELIQKNTKNVNDQISYNAQIAQSKVLDIQTCIYPYILNRKKLVEENKYFFAEIDKYDMINYQEEIFDSLNEQIKKISERTYGKQQPTVAVGATGTSAINISSSDTLNQTFSSKYPSFDKNNASRITEAVQDIRQRNSFEKSKKINTSKTTNVLQDSQPSRKKKKK